MQIDWFLCLIYETATPKIIYLSYHGESSFDDLVYRTVGKFQRSYFQKFRKSSSFFENIF